MVGEGSDQIIKQLMGTQDCRKCVFNEMKVGRCPYECGYYKVVSFFDCTKHNCVFVLEDVVDEEDTPWIGN